jgi:hypothetical protein
VERRRIELRTSGVNPDADRPSRAPIGSPGPQVTPAKDNDLGSCFTPPPAGEKTIDTEDHEMPFKSQRIDEFLPFP